MTLSEFAVKGLGWDINQASSSSDTIRPSVVADSIRMAIYSLYVRNSPPVPIYNLEIRNWIKHKLLPIIPDLFESEDENYKQVLTEGRGSSLEFLGDAVVLSDGYLCPGPSRFIDIGNGSFLVVSGLPTKYFLSISHKIVHTQLGRRIDNTSRSELQAVSDKIQSVDDYIGSSTGIQLPVDLLRTIMSSAWQPWISDPGWEIYLGNLEPGVTLLNNKYGFRFAQNDSPSASKGLISVLGDIHLSVWRLPMPGSDRYYSYWLKEQSGVNMKFHNLGPFGWKQVCIALDYLAGKPRQSTIYESVKDSSPFITLGFPPFETLAKSLSAFGAVYKGRSRGLDNWEISKIAAKTMSALLERSGLKVKLL